MESVKDEVALRASAISMAFSVENPFLLRCALHLKILDIIWNVGPDVSLFVQQIATQLPSEDPDLGALSRILSYLSSMGILQAVKAEEGINMKYGLTNLSKSYFTSADINRRSLVPLVLLQTHPTYVTAWANIHERVLHGGDNWKKSSGNGKDFWSFAGSHPEFSAIFNAGMVAVTKATMEDILAVYDGFKDVNTLVDVGGGHGDALSLIIDAYPHIRGINFDLPQVIATAPTLPGIFLIPFLNYKYTFFPHI